MSQHIDESDSETSSNVMVGGVGNEYNIKTLTIWFYKIVKKVFQTL